MKPVAIALLSLAATWSAGAAPDIDATNLAELHGLMQPRPGELVWRQIDWHTNLWDARVEAAATGKPIYLWEMDGHPLGCT